MQKSIITILEPLRVISQLISPSKVSNSIPDETNGLKFIFQRLESSSFCDELLDTFPNIFCKFFQANLHVAKVKIELFLKP